MQFTKFGQTGLTVSRMILGTGTFGKQTDENEAHRMLDKAAEAGIHFIDTADIYPPGAEAGGAEIITGRWLSSNGASSSDTVASPVARRARIARRVGSARAEKALLSRSAVGS